MGVFSFNDITVTEVAQIFTCTHLAGSTMNMYDRPACGITLAIEGKIIYRHSSGEYLSDTSHAVFIPKGETYMLDCIETGRFTVLNFGAEHFPNSFKSIQISDLSGLLKIQSELERLRVTEPFERLATIGGIYRMLTELMERSTEYSMPPPLKRAMDFAARNYCDPNFSTEMLAKAAGVSEIYLRKLFRECRNISPSKYVRDCRVRHALNLLAGSEMSIGEIAEDCGYTDPSVFSKVFKKYVGCTPSEYRDTVCNVGEKTPFANMYKY